MNIAKYAATIFVGTLAAVASVELYRQLQERYAVGLEVRARSVVNDVLNTWELERTVNRELPYLQFDAYYATREAAPDDRN